MMHWGKCIGIICSSANIQTEASVNKLWQDHHQL